MEQIGLLTRYIDENTEKYKLEKDITLTPEAETVFNEKFKLFIEKAMGLYRTMFDIRTLDTKIPENYPLRSYLAETVKHAATQGYTNAVQVIYYIIQYYIKIIK